MSIRPRELERLTDGDEYELIDGRIVEKRGGALMGQIGATLAAFVGQHIWGQKLGHLFGCRAGYKECFPGRENHLLRPSLSFVAEARIPNGKVPVGDFDIAPDWVAEIIGEQTFNEVEERVADYRSAGVRLIWIINPSTKSVLVRRLDRTCAELDETGTLDGEDVIPGFTCPVADLFA